MKVLCNGLAFAGNIKLAANFFTRFKGLMGEKYIGIQDGLLLKNCSSVHCFFMKVPIDVVYLSKEMNILEIETLAPWHIGKIVKNTAHVLEIAAGAAKGKIAVGDRVELKD